MWVVSAVGAFMVAIRLWHLPRQTPKEADEELAGSHQAPEKSKSRGRSRRRRSRFRWVTSGRNRGQSGRTHYWWRRRAGGSVTATLRGNCKVFRKGQSTARASGVRVAIFGDLCVVCLNPFFDEQSFFVVPFGQVDRSCDGSCRRGLRDWVFLFVERW